MDIGKADFHHELLNILGDISESHFVAFDLEFSGIPARGDREAGKPSLQQVYQELKHAVEKYQILQVGLTIVKEDAATGQYVALPFNFNISPVPSLRERYFRRDWSMNSGAISFLLRHGFDFGAQISQGVPYLSRKEEEQARNNMTAEAKRTDMVLKPEDEPLASHIRSAIARWQARPRAGDDNFLNIPDSDAGTDIPNSLNRYQLRLTHQIVENEFPGFKTRGMGHFIQITNPSESYQANEKLLEAQQRDKDLARAVGFRWIFEGIMGRDITSLPDEFVLPIISRDTRAEDGTVPLKAVLGRLNNQLRKRRKVLIGHNCFTDLIYIYRMIVGELPDNVQDFADQIHEMFPAIVDTKYLSDRHSEKYGRANLEEVEKDLRAKEHPSIDLMPGFERYTAVEPYHEAGYDSFATATVAIKLSAVLHTNGSSRKEADMKYRSSVTDHGEGSSLEFGADEDYITATESIPDSEHSDQARPSFSPLVSAIKSFCYFDLVENTHVMGFSQTQLSSSSAQPVAPPTIVAVKEKKHKHPQPRNDKLEVESIRSTFATTNIYDALEETAADVTTLPTEGDKASETTAQMTPLKKAKRLDKLVKEGKLMPRWHEENDFWQIHGNKVQVNGCKEGVLVLTGR